MGDVFFSPRMSLGYHGVCKQEWDIWVSLKMGSISPVPAILRGKMTASGSSRPHWGNEGPIVGRVADIISGFILFTFSFFPSVRIDVNTVWQRWDMRFSGMGRPAIKSMPSVLRQQKMNLIQALGLQGRMISTTCFACSLCSDSWCLASPLGIEAMIWCFHWSFSEHRNQDLWNIGLVHKNKKNYDEAAPMLDQAQKLGSLSPKAHRLVDGPTKTNLNSPKCPSPKTCHHFCWGFRRRFFQLQALEKWLEEDPEERFDRWSPQEGNWLSTPCDYR